MSETQPITMNPQICQQCGRPIIGQAVWCSLGACHPECVGPPTQQWAGNHAAQIYALEERVRALEEKSKCA